MTRLRTAVAAAGLALAVLPGAAGAAVELKGVDSLHYPTIRLSAVTSKPSDKPPALLENGMPVAALKAENLARAKSLVLAVDLSRSMKGGPFAHASAAARSFVAGKPQDDRIAIVGFGSKAVQLTRFSSATIDTDSALRTLQLDQKQGTALYDAVVLSARALQGELLAGRVIVVLTDGADTSSDAQLADASRAARNAGAAVYTVGIEGEQFSPAPLRTLAADTGGSYRGTRSSSQLSAVYAEIARELRRTWRLEYLTAARPGDALRLQASVPGHGSAGATFSLPGDSAAPATSPPSKLLPTRLYESVLGTQIMALVVGFLVLLSGAFLIASMRSDRLRRRLAPHVGERKRTAKGKGGREERLAAAAGLFRATEQTFAHWRQWLWLQRLIERADVPLRTVEFAYLIVASALVGGLFAAFAALPSPAILAALAIGGTVPVGVIWFKGQQRLKAFENQLPDLLITLAATLKAGHSFKQGLQTVVDEGRPPASKELKRVLTEAQLGRPMDDALNDMALRVGSKNFDFVITAVNIQKQVGGSLAGLIDMVADTVRQRQQFARKIKGLTAMGRASAYVLMGLPFFVGAIITIMNPTYMDPLYHSSTGHKLIGTGLAMMVFGALVLKKIVSFKG